MLTLNAAVEVDSDDFSLWLNVTVAGFVFRLDLSDDVIDKVIMAGDRYFISPNPDGTLEIHSERSGGPLPEMTSTMDIDGAVEMVLDSAKYETYYNPDEPPGPGQAKTPPDDNGHFASLEACLAKWLGKTRDAIRALEAEREGA